MTPSEIPRIGGGPFQLKLLLPEFDNPGHVRVRGGCLSGTHAAPSRPQS